MSVHDNACWHVSNFGISMDRNESVNKCTLKESEQTSVLRYGFFKVSKYSVVIVSLV